MFKPRSYDPERRDERTQAQKAATERNFRVFRLHGLHSQMGLLTGPRRELARQLVDQELLTLGAMTTDQARDEQIKKRYRAHAKRKCPDCKNTYDNCECLPF